LADLKTQPNDRSVEDFLNRIEDKNKRLDSFKLLELMQSVTGEQPRMWGDTIVGFGSYHHRYASGREGDWFLTGFSPRKQSLTLYIMAGFDRYQSLMAGLGRFTTGKSCLYVKKLDDIDYDTLRELVRLSAEHVARTNPG
jgi:hypothetical protein